MYSYEELVELNKNKCVTFVSVENNTNDPTGMNDNIIVKHNENAESILGFNNLFSKYFITNISELKSAYKRVYRSMAMIDAQNKYEQTGIKIKLSHYTKQFEIDWNIIVINNNKKSMKIVGFNTRHVSFTTNVPLKYDSTGKISGFAEIDIKHFMKTGDNGVNNRYINNISDAKQIIDKMYNTANRVKQNIENRAYEVREMYLRNTSIFDTIKDILSKCAKEYGISKPYNDTKDSYSIKYTYISSDDKFEYETTNTVTITMNPKAIKIKYNLWKNSDNFDNAKVIEKNILFDKIDNKAKMRKLVEQIIKSLKSEV